MTHIHQFVCQVVQKGGNIMKDAKLYDTAVRVIYVTAGECRIDFNRSICCPDLDKIKNISYQNILAGNNDAIDISLINHGIITLFASTAEKRELKRAAKSFVDYILSTAEA